MLNAAMVLMILAGVVGLPAALCSATCAGFTSAAGMRSDPNAADAQTYLDVLMGLSLVASIGSIIVGALVRRLGKIPSGVAALVFASIFAFLLIQANALGLPSSLMLLLAAIMIFVAPADQFTGIKKVKIEE